MNSKSLKALLGIVALALVPGPAVRAGDFPPVHAVSDAGLVRLDVTADGIVGNGFLSSSLPSCEYPAGSHVEHLYLGGLWVGAATPTGVRRVSTSDRDAGNLSIAESINEFAAVPGVGGPDFRVMSDNPADPDYAPGALAPWHLECRFADNAVGPAGHVPLGLEITLRALAWNQSLYDDFVILDYTITNVSGVDLADVYVGFFNDTTVGNTDWTDPWDPTAYRRWNYFDDLNGAWRPGDFPDDPGLWMMHEHDADGDEGLAPSWVGCRLLGTVPAPAAPYGYPPVAYNCWSYNRGPAQDDWYPDPSDPTTTLPGRYQVLGNGHFDVGVTPDGDFTTTGNRVGLLSVGPFPVLAAGATVSVTFATVLGADADALRRHGRMAQLAYDSGYAPSVSAVHPPRADEPVLGPATPNPFNPLTRVAYATATDGPVRLTVHDLRGRLVATLVDGPVAAGPHAAVWDGRDAGGRPAAAGTYLLRLRTSAGTAAGKVVLVE